MKTTSNTGTAMTTTETQKETIQHATAEIMRGMIKKSRERFQAMPDGEKARIVRGMEDAAWS